MAARRRSLGEFRGAAITLLALLAMLVAAATWAGIASLQLTGRGAPIWIADAVIAVAALKAGRKSFPWILAAGYCGLMIGNLIAGVDVVHGITLAAINIVDVSILSLPLRHFVPDLDFARPRTLLAFYGLALGPAPIVCALLASLALWALDGIDIWTTAQVWYIGDALGLVILVPPLVATRMRDVMAVFSPRALMGTLGVASVMALAIAVNMIGRDYPVAFLFFPAIMLMTFVRGFVGGVLGLVAVDAYMLVPVLIHDPANTLVMHSLREQVAIILLFAAVMSFTVILAGAALEHRRRLEREMACALVRAEGLREEALVAKDAAENASRTKSMFLANMSHELRTPLNAVIGFSEMMQGEIFGPVGDARYRDYTRLIHDAGEHLLELINDILDMSKIEAGKFEIERLRLDAREIVGDCLSLMQEHASAARVDLSGDLPAGPLWVMADRRALKQILLNLVSNAVKFTPAGGSVTVSLDARAQLQGDEPVWRIVVRDTGIGIPPEAIKRLGSPFVQIRDSADRAHKGTGLGLALVRALAEMHDGALHIESAPGTGTTVTVKLPVGAVEVQTKTPQTGDRAA